ncbi:hypothetical protein [Candidatus Albibeggiatoa sp. nov. BB20]|uniref:hypothetical protein n=1 Tax=Candidatus Albibeggiatoa sp. nov. BB20 TaxID=3162723 RepID=UPI0033659EE8
MHNQSKAVVIKHGKDGIINTAMSFKLCNVILNLKVILFDFEKCTQKSIDLLGIFAGATSER